MTRIPPIISKTYFDAILIFSKNGRENQKPEDKTEELQKSKKIRSEKQVEGFKKAQQIRSEKNKLIKKRPRESKK